MKRNHKILSVSPIILLLAGACNSESQRTEPVATTTGQGSSTAPPAKEAEKRDQALVRVVHAIPGSPAVDAFVGNTKEFNNVMYKTVTPYKEVADTKEQFAIRPTGQDAAQPLAQNSEGISGGNHYTAIAMLANDGKPTLRVISDKLTPPSTGKASVRVVHASPDAGEVDVFVKGKEDSLFGGVNAQSVTNYNDVDPMTATLEIRPQGSKTVALNVPNMVFEAGHLYTIVVTGKAKGSPKLEATKIDDHLTGTGMTMGQPTGQPSPTATAR